MSVLNLHPEDTKMVVNFFFADESYLDEAISCLRDIYGPVEYKMEPVPFNHTTYYHEELGDNLKKALVCFKELVPRDSLPELKHETDKLERLFAEKMGGDKKRPINIDPGLLFPEKFVLATGRNFPHRIYLGRGIYADLTLLYRQDCFEALPWTYTDYLEVDVLNFLSKARKKLVEQLRIKQKEDLDSAS